MAAGAHHDRRIDGGTRRSPSRASPRTAARRSGPSRTEAGARPGRQADQDGRADGNHWTSTPAAAMRPRTASSPAGGTPPSSRTRLAHAEHHHGAARRDGEGAQEGGHADPVGVRRGPLRKGRRVAVGPPRGGHRGCVTADRAGIGPRREPDPSCRSPSGAPNPMPERTTMSTVAPSDHPHRRARRRRPAAAGPDPYRRSRSPRGAVLLAAGMTSAAGVRRRPRATWRPRS